MTTQQILQGVHDWTNGKIVYDISVAHPDGQGNPTKYADLTAALGTGGGNIPEGLRKGGMSIKFIQSSDNKYVQYRLMASSFSTIVSDWQSVDDEVAQLKNALGDSTGNKPIEFVKDYYIPTNINQVDINDIRPSSTSFEYAIIDVNEGDMFTLNGTGGDNARHWCFIDENSAVLAVSLPNESTANQVIIAPPNATKLIVQDNYTTCGISYFDVPIKNTVSDTVDSTVDGILKANCMRYKGIYIVGSTSQIALKENASDSETLVVACEPNKVYKITKITSGIFRIGYTTEFPKPNTVVSNLVNAENETEFVYTTGNNAKYIVITYYNSSIQTSPSADSVFESITFISTTAKDEIARYNIEKFKDEVNQKKWYKTTNISTYQWQYISGGTWTNSGATGANTDEVTFTATSAINGRKFRCKITDGDGNNWYSGTFQLHVGDTTLIEYNVLDKLSYGINMISEPKADFYVKTNEQFQLKVSVLIVSDVSEIFDDSTVVNKIKSNDGIDLNNINLWEKGTIDSSGNNGSETIATYPYRIRTRNYIPQSFIKMIRHREAVQVHRYSTSGSYIGMISSSIDVPDVYYFDHANYKYRIVIPGPDNELSNYSMVEFYGRKGIDLHDGLTRFSYPETMEEMNVEGFDFSQHQDGYYHIIEDVYDAFDELVTNYPSMVSKADVAELLNMTYPSYANGGDGTPVYKTYMYTISTNNAYAGNNGNTKKKKMLILGGVHGNEIAAPVNLYLFAKSIINISTRDMFRLLSAFDIYIIPCVNGWGMYHLTRINANGVNINRNYPIARWAASGSPGDSNYTGAEAGDQFETQLVMGITDYIKPDLCCDFHNYGTYNNRQFYLESCHVDTIDISYQSMQECAYALIKNKSSYFGVDYNLFIQIGGSTPLNCDFSTEGKGHRWWYEHGVPLSFGPEISACINYWNGEYKSQGRDLYGNDTFSVGQYTFRNMLCHYAEHLLKNAL